MNDLTVFEKGDKVTICHITCGYSLKHRLLELGLFYGAEIEMVKNDQWGPVVIKIFASNVALGRGEARKIYGRKA